LMVEKDLSQIRNEVHMFGAFAGYRIPLEKGKHLSASVRRIHTGSTDEEGYVPWRSMVIDQGKYNDFGVLKRTALELFKRVNRVRKKAQWSTWGQPKIQPFDVIKVIEKVDFTGLVEGKENLFRVTAITHALDASRQNFTSSITGEWIDKLNPDAFIVPGGARSNVT